jgi:threonine dehydratase
MDYQLSLDVIQAARERIQPYVRHTPLMPLPPLGDDLPAQLRLKLENLQVVGSFKPRGVFNTLLQLDYETRRHGVVAASGGNHGLALAYAANRLGIPATVYLPATASADRVARIGVWGAKLVQHGITWDDAHQAALQYAASEIMYYVHPFDADATLAGQGTLGLELLDDLPELDCVLIASGGGGLLAGMSAAIKTLKPNVHIIGVEPVGAPTVLRSIEARRVVELPEVRTIADTLSPRATGDRALALARRYVDEIVLVEDSAMIDAMRWLWLNANQLVEPSGVATIAALRTGKADVSAFQCPVALICGGNAAADSVWKVYEDAAAAKGTLKQT